MKEQQFGSVILTQEHKQLIERGRSVDGLTFKNGHKLDDEQVYSG